MPSGRKCGRPRRTWRGGDRIAGMIRSIAIAATLGAVVAGVAAYAIYPSMRPSEPTPAEQAAAADDGWPICTMTVTMPDADWAKLDPEFGAGKKAVLAEGWDGAIAVLKSAALRDPRNADIQNYIGYA